MILTRFDPATCLLLWCVISLIGQSGCSRSADGPARYALQGRVVYQGKPVPAGEVFFEPDAEAGNSGPAGIADIQDGKYRTRPEWGVVGGPHVIRVLGYESRVPVNAGLGEFGKPLFSEKRVKADLPKTSGEFEIVIDK